MRAVIAGTGHHLPEQRVTTAEVERRLSELNGFTVPPGLLQLLTGVRERYWAADDETTSDLAAAAARNALDDAGIHPMSVDLLIVSSASHDVAEPSTASIAQGKIGCTEASTMDIKSACNSFVNGLDVATAMIETGRANTVLVTAGEVITPVVQWDISSMSELRRRFAGLTLGDAAGAAVVTAHDGEAGPAERGVLPGRFMTDGQFWELCTVKFGGSLNRLSLDGGFECRSDELAKLALLHLPDMVKKTLEGVGWTTDDIDIMIPHQVSRAVIVDVARRCNNFPLDRCMITVDRYGNNAAASIPMALSMAAEQKRITRGDKVLLVGGAAGFSAGVVPIVW